MHHLKRFLLILAIYTAILGTIISLIMLTNMTYRTPDYLAGGVSDAELAGYKVGTVFGSAIASFIISLIPAGLTELLISVLVKLSRGSKKKD
jgi:hypothetical protein